MELNETNVILKLSELAIKDTRLYVSGMLPCGSLFENMPIRLSYNAKKPTEDVGLKNEFYRKLCVYEDAKMPTLKALRKALEDKSFVHFSETRARLRKIRAKGKPILSCDTMTWGNEEFGYYMYATDLSGEDFLFQMHLNEDTDILKKMSIFPLITQISVNSSEGFKPVIESSFHKDREKLKPVMKEAYIAEIVDYCKKTFLHYCGNEINDYAREFAGELAARITIAANISALLDDHALEELHATHYDAMNIKQPENRGWLAEVETPNSEIWSSPYTGARTGSYCFGTRFLNGAGPRLEYVSKIETQNGEIIPIIPMEIASKYAFMVRDNKKTIPMELIEEAEAKAYETLGLSEKHEIQM